jgi:hypothetical protein
VQICFSALSHLFVDPRAAFSRRVSSALYLRCPAPPRLFAQLDQNNDEAQNKQAAAENEFLQQKGEQGVRRKSET